MKLVTRNYPNTRTAWPVLFDEFFNDPFLNTENTGCEADWSPRMEVEENDNNYYLTVEVPGMSKKDIDIKVENNIITLSGEKKDKKVKKENSYTHLKEISYGKFSRSFKLPGNVDVDKISAKWNEGVLSVEIPKPEVSKAKKIDIN